jgi:ligand-binding sensor domain-containing protein
LLVQKSAGGSRTKRYVHDTDDPASLSSDFVNAIVKDRKGKLWIGTDGGLDLWNINTGGFVHYRKNPK